MRAAEANCIAAPGTRTSGTLAERGRPHRLGGGPGGQCASAQSPAAQAGGAQRYLALLYGPGGLSLRSAASYATEAGIADLCDVSLLGRLRNAGAFLGEVLASL